MVRARVFLLVYSRQLHTAVDSFRRYIHELCCLCAGSPFCLSQEGAPPVTRGEHEGGKEAYGTEHAVGAVPTNFTDMERGLEPGAGDEQVQDTLNN